MAEVTQPFDIIQPDIAATVSILEQRQRETQNGQDYPHLRNFEVVCLQFMANFLRNGNPAPERWLQHPEETTVPIAIAHEVFVQANPDFVPDFVAGRLVAQSKFVDIVEQFREHELIGYDNSILIPIPVLLMQVDNIQELSNDLQVKPDTISQVLNEIQYLKATNYLIFGSSNIRHNFPGFLDRETPNFGIKRDEFIEKQQLHELLELLTHPLTERRFGVYATWYNEGVGDKLAGFNARASAGLKRLDSTPSLNQLLKDGEAIGTSKSTDTIVLHAKSWLLVSAISKAYSPENSDQGLFQFSKKLFGDGTRSQNSLNTETLNILHNDELISTVEEQIESLFTHIVKT